MFSIITATEECDLAVAAALFREYESWLGMDLCFQGFEEELRSLPGKYAPPDGRLLIAFDGDSAAGCIALRRFDATRCEMKRLYVSPTYRGRGLGVLLIEKVMDEARRIGYEKMLLDTYPPKMEKAVKLYVSHGFRPIAPYYDNPHNGVLFMEADL